MTANWDHLKVVLAIYRGGSLTAAATLLVMDQTTAGRRLSALEEQLGTSLFLRSKGGFQATEAGQIVIDNALRIEARLDRMRETIDDLHEGASGVLRLAGNNWMLQLLAERVLPDFLEKHPKIELRISARLPPGPIHSEPTVSLWFDAVPHALDHATPMCSLSYAAYQSKGTAIEDTDWVQFQDDVAQGPSFARRLRQRMTPSQNVRLTATDAHILQGAIRAGLARGVLPICLGDRDPLLERVPGQDVMQRVLHFHASEDARRLKRVALIYACIAQSVGTIFAGSKIRSMR